MSDSNVDGGANSTGTSGAVAGEQKEDKAFLALKEEKRRLAEKAGAAESRLAELEAEKKSREEEVLKQQGEYKKLWEEEQKAKAELASKLKQKEEKELALRKIDVLMQELGAPLAKPEYWDFVDLSRIPVDDSTNDIDRNIAKQVASEFVQKYPELLVKKSTRLPSEAPSSSSQLTYEDWAKLPIEEKRKRIKDVKR